MHQLKKTFLIIVEWSERIGCSEEVMRHCIMRLGPSFPAVKAYYEMNKDRLKFQFDVETPEGYNEPNLE